jgi:fructan beta-fructosidase
VPELQNIIKERHALSVSAVRDTLDLSDLADKAQSQFILEGLFDEGDFKVVLSNQSGQHITFGFDPVQDIYYIDRQSAGQNDFSANFNKVATAPRLSTDSIIQFTMVADVSSLEFFLDDGLTVMTAIFFPDSIMDRLHIVGSSDELGLKSLEFGAIKRIWIDQSSK